jgi:hypothetical protein
MMIIKRRNINTFACKVGRHWKKEVTDRRRSLRFCRPGNFGRDKNLTHRNKLFELGLYYDYPLCCVKALSRRERVPKSKKQKEAIERLHATKMFTHVPCQACAVKYLGE